MRVPRTQPLLTRPAQRRVPVLLALALFAHAGSTDASSAALARHRHVGYTNNSDEMLVIFITMRSSPPPVVQWGYSSGGALTNTARGTSTTYTAKDMCNAPANESNIESWTNPGWIHRVVLHGLRPGARVYYRCGHQNEILSQEASFRARGGDRTDTSFLMYADQALPVPLLGPAYKLIDQVQLQAHGRVSIYAALEWHAHSSCTGPPHVINCTLRTVTHPFLFFAGRARY